MNTMINLIKPEIKMKTTALRHKQLKFAFDQSDVRNTKEILTHVDALIADNGHIILKDVISKFSEKLCSFNSVKRDGKFFITESQ